MECRVVKVELLTEDEALNLFMSKVEEHQTVEIATKESKECVRLPLAIINIAGSMRGVNDIVHCFLQQKLQEKLPKLQHCFLFCALYLEDDINPREELIEYWIAEGLIAKMNSIEAMFDKGHTILNKLINTCLLESLTNIHKEEFMRLHDLIRDIALKIT
ncbi:Disease resistance protein [Camellia lanceoleosa]|uniref:Disease resistance protein n=1 Tax=Camellia lanceoleosa TaxID=1840588 RepID=A0ACC0FGY2_9ERIC|nr:Disease resistance protein [Camellia lanceoleosa]